MRRVLDVCAALADDVGGGTRWLDAAPNASGVRRFEGGAVQAVTGYDRWTFDAGAEAIAGGTGPDVEAHVTIEGGLAFSVMGRGPLFERPPHVARASLPWAQLRAAAELGRASMFTPGARVELGHGWRVETTRGTRGLELRVTADPPRPGGRAWFDRLLAEPSGVRLVLRVAVVIELGPGEARLRAYGGPVRDDPWLARAFSDTVAVWRAPFDARLHAEVRRAIARLALTDCALPLDADERPLGLELVDADGARAFVPLCRRAARHAPALRALERAAADLEAHAKHAAPTERAPNPEASEWTAADHAHARDVFARRAAAEKERAGAVEDELRALREKLERGG